MPTTPQTKPSPVCPSRRHTGTTPPELAAPEVDFNPNPTRKPGATKIRKDYRTQTKWTLQEAAHEFGVSAKTISNLLSSGCIKRAYLIGAYRVDASSAYRYFETGKPQA